MKILAGSFVALSFIAFFILFTPEAFGITYHTIDTTPGNGDFGSFGEGDGVVATGGQTFTVPEVETVLNNFTFFADDLWDQAFPPFFEPGPDFYEFEAIVMAWDGAKATGPILFNSGLIASTGNGGAGDHEAFSFDTLGLQLTGGNQYVAFFSSSNVFDDEEGQADFSAADNLYSGGTAVALENGSDFSQITTQNWTTFGFDLAFTMSFSSPSIPGDINSDASVNSEDVKLFLENYGRIDSNGFPDGDFNNDGKTDLDDLLILKQQFGVSNNAPIPISTPEPSPLILSVIGIIGLVLIGWLRRSKLVI